jgi:hypothetical protein
MSRILRTLPLAAMLIGASLSGVQAACAGGHVQVTLGDFPREAVSSPFYWASEGDGQVTFILRALAHDCAPNAVTISYATKPGSAAEGTDYVPASGSRAATTDATHGDGDRQPVGVTVINDFVLEAVVKSATVELTSAQGGQLVAPTSAALHIVDDDGLTSLVSLDPAATYRQLETFNLGGVPVFRGGSASGEVTVGYTVEPGPAPAASPGADYRAESGTLTFAAGDRIEMVPITLVNDRDTEDEEKLTVTLTGVEGATLDPNGRASAEFTIVDNEELYAPESLFHHPRNRFKYKAKDFRIREIHVFTEDKGGAGVTDADMALRKDLSGRGCEWWSGKRWKRRSCKDHLWVPMDIYEPDFFYLRLPELAPSRGAIKSYTAFSRAIDGSGNRERRLEPGRNANTFDIK